MIKIGDDNTLRIARSTSIGLYLTDGEKDILLPNKYVPKQYEIDQELVVFVYLDQEERPVATTLEPYIYRDEFALLKVSYINQYGAFMDMGLEKDLFVPFREQARPMKEGHYYLIYMSLDEKSNRLVGSSRLNQFLDNSTLTVEVGEEVELVVSHITDLGINVIINDKHKGLIYKNEVYEDLRTGDRVIGYIKSIRPDGKIDVTRQKVGFDGVLTTANAILEALEDNNGFLGLTDNSHPEDIKTVLNISKKTFKKAVGTLYKNKQIDITDKGIVLLKK
ncbi:CvfB family protein [Myroides pelagicus]|uniref:GntR family transcriptional regulator n=1 Tax=Myroides pelagicus TaxID=270914 RepID=A0A7K1GK58_9FLAO|nr:S1-like domain-containing RNA-binding protein [Myroides pelagicus]MEC4113458.1 S1-like domain-containing RNA-binding protein [Myroides pelagicus]MTH29257.1 GntR family transcriptional regulator [Myroides pelagicus]